MCHKTPTGPVCGCRNGYQLSDNLKSCEDVNECEDNVCSQLCHNTNGSYTCSCYEGYVIRSDKTSCKVAGKEILNFLSFILFLNNYLITKKR